MNTDRVELSRKQSAYVADQIARFSSESPEKPAWLVPHVEKHGVLPLLIDWVETTGIMPDGAIRKFSADGAYSDYEGVRPVDEPVHFIAALVKGAQAHPPLRSLIPARPREARDCEDCGGAGQFQGRSEFICMCGGVGWRLPDEAPSGGAASDNPYEPPAAAPLDTREPQYQKTVPVLAAWATAAMFLAVSAALLYPFGGVEQMLARGNVPPLPRVIVETLAYRHVWHLLTAAAIGLAIALQSWRQARARTLGWVWVSLTLIWLAGYALSFIAGFYINLYALAAWQREVRLREIFTAYLAAMSIAVLLVMVWQRWRRA